jgi:hypothetical protein
MHLVKCGHCPASLATWPVEGDETDVIRSVDEHIHRTHPGTGQWTEEDWELMTEEDVVAEAAFFAVVPLVYKSPLLT